MNGFWFFAGLFVFILIVIEIPMFAGIFSASPWLPTPKKDLERINRFADLKRGQTFFDIGCGDGRICNYIFKHNPGVRVTGFEIAYPLYFWSKMRAGFAQNRSGLKGGGSLEIKLKDIFKVDFSRVDVVYFWGIKRGVEKLKPKFMEMKKGSKIIIYFDEIKGRKYAIKNRPGKTDVPIFVYEN
jgi:SAM-dependent methyltransferase